jgi:hypothetical protein
VDLITLVREIQWPDLEAGTTMEAIDRALRARGVHTYAMKLLPEARLKWPFPVLAHLETENDKGHFVVWLPESSGNLAGVWCGLPGKKLEEEREWARHRSGAVLLTAPHAIENPDGAAEPAGSARSILLFAAGGLSCLFVLFVVGIRARKSCMRRN